MNATRLIALSAIAFAIACGAPAPAAKKTISMEDTVAAFGHTKVDTTGLGAARVRAATSQQQLDSQNAAIRARQRGATLPPPKRIIRKAP